MRFLIGRKSVSKGNRPMQNFGLVMMPVLGGSGAIPAEVYRVRWHLGLQHSSVAATSRGLGRFHCNPLCISTTVPRMCIPKFWSHGWSMEAKSLRTVDTTCATTSVAAAVGRVRWSPSNGTRRVLTCPQHLVTDDWNQWSMVDVDD